MIVVLDNIRSAHNVGSILRTCDSLGINEIHICGITPGPANSKVLKTSLGAEKKLLIKYFPNTYEDVLNLKKNSLKIIGLEVTKEAVDINTIKLNEPIALVIGNEINGISSDILKACHNIVKIPMRGLKESLNVSVAFGIAAYTIINNLDT